MITRDEIMEWFRDDNDCENINSLSIDDRHELMISLCAHSDDLETALQKMIDTYEG